MCKVDQTAVVLMSLLLGLSIASNGGSEGCRPPQRGDWVVQSAVVCDGADIVLKGNLFVARSGSLTFKHVTLRIDSEYAHQFEIRVEGEFHVLSSKITAVSTDKGYAFTYAQGSRGIIDSSTIERMGGVRQRLEPGRSRGLTINADDFVIQNSIIQDSSRGIAISGNNATVAHNIIRSVFHCGITVMGNRITQTLVQGKIYGNRIYDVLATNGITLSWAEYEVYGNEISRVHDNALEAEFSKVSIHDNTFAYNVHALDIRHYSSAEVFNNAFSNSTESGIWLNYNQNIGGFIHIYSNEINKHRTCGIEVHSSMNVLIERNVIKDLPCGILFDGWYHYRSGVAGDPNWQGSRLLPDSTNNVTVRSNTFANILQYFSVAEDVEVVFQENVFQGDEAAYFDDFEDYQAPGAFWLHPGIEVEVEGSNHVLSVSFGEERNGGLWFSALHSQLVTFEVKVKLLEGRCLIGFSTIGDESSWFAHSLILGGNEVFIFSAGATEPFRMLQRRPITLQFQRWYTVKILIESKRAIKVYLDGNSVIDYTSLSPLPNISFGLDADFRSHVHYDDMLITAAHFEQ